MAFKQYTHCIEKSDFDSFWNFGGKTQDPVVPLAVNGILQGIKYAIFGAIGGFLIGVLAGNPTLGSLLGADIGFAYGLIEGFCDQWLNRRLICIQRDSCAVGRVGWIETPAKKDLLERVFDNDISMNVRLSPYDGSEFHLNADNPSDADFAPKHTATDIENDNFPAAALLKRRFGDLKYEGYDGDESAHERPELKPNHPGGRWSLHCECEGNAMETLCAIGKFLAMLAPLLTPLGVAAGLVGGAIFGAKKAYDAVHDGCKKVCKIPIVCDVVCFLAGAAAAVAGGFVGATVGAVLGVIPGVGPLVLGVILGQFFNTDGSFADAANDPESGNVEPEDCLFAAGDLVYDAGHPDGWHELHPVKHIQMICKHGQEPQLLFAPGVPGSDPFCCPHLPTNSPDFNSAAFRNEVQAFWDQWCAGYKTTLDPITVGQQEQPQNQWCLHPLVDGCQPEERIR
jgi:hypothetical protein